MFRLWRDLGYAVGALLTGIIADALGLNASIIAIAVLTLGSALIIEQRMRCQTNAIKLMDWLLQKAVNKKKHKIEILHERVALAFCLLSK